MSLPQTKRDFFKNLRLYWKYFSKISNRFWNVINNFWKNIQETLRKLVKILKKWYKGKLGKFYNNFVKHWILRNVFKTCKFIVSQRNFEKIGRFSKHRPVSCVNLQEFWKFSEIFENITRNLRKTLKKFTGNFEKCKIFWINFEKYKKFIQENFNDKSVSEKLLHVIFENF